MLDSHTTVLDTITNHLFPSRRGMNRRPGRNNGLYHRLQHVAACVAKAKAPTIIWR